MNALAIERARPGDIGEIEEFRKVDRSTITGALRGSAEFTGACPDSALCMERVL